MKKDPKTTILSIQNDEKYVILNNPLATPKFIRMMGKDKEVAISDIYTPKIFYEIASRLTPKDLEGVRENQNIKMDIQISQFLRDIGANPKNHNHLITSIGALQTTILKWKEDKKTHRSSIINYSIHDPKSGKVQIQIHEKLVRHILEVNDKENYSFLKSNVFRLQNAQAIRLYPFFKSWENYKGGYLRGLEDFKNDFGYDTGGYKKFSNFELKVLKPATEEINEKTDIFVTYETKGENLDGLRPRVTGLIFWVTSKDKIKILPNGQPHTPQESTRSEPVQQTAVHQEPDTKEQLPSTDLETLYKAWKKIKFEDSQYSKSEHYEDFVPTLVEMWGFDAVYDALIGLSKSGIVLKGMGIFLKPETYTLNKGNAQKEQKKQEIKIQQQKEAQQVQEQERFFSEVERKYNEDKKKHYQKKYNELTEENREQYLQEIWDGAKLKSVYFRNNNRNDPNSYAVEQVGEIVTFPNGYDYQKAIKGYALKTFAVQIDFDENDKMIFANLVNVPIESDPVPVGKFDREKAQQQAAPEATKEIEPKAIIEQNEIKPTALDVNKRTSNEEEAPKGFSDLLRSGANNLFNKFTKK